MPRTFFRAGHEFEDSFSCRNRFCVSFRALNQQKHINQCLQSPIVSNPESRVCGFSFFRILNGKAVGVPISNQNAFSFDDWRYRRKHSDCEDVFKVAQVVQIVL